MWLDGAHDGMGVAREPPDRVGRPNGHGGNDSLRLCFSIRPDSRFERCPRRYSVVDDDNNAPGHCECIPGAAKDARPALRLFELPFDLLRYVAFRYPETTHQLAVHQWWCACNDGADSQLGVAWSTELSGNHHIKRHTQDVGRGRSYGDPATGDA